MRIQSWVQRVAPLAAVLAFGQSNEGLDLFREKVRPLFASRCQGCHNDTLKFSGLTLESGEGLKRGGLHGPVVAPGDPGGSRLFRKVARLEKPYMPMQGDPLTPPEIESVKRWIELGAPFPEEQQSTDAEKARQDRLAAMKRMEERRAITAKDRDWWSFRKPVRPIVPAVKARTKVINPVDAFILAQLEKKGLQPAPFASRRVLIRRIYFDLTGLPPRPEDVQAFLNDRSPDAYSRLIDRLLDSERYGERWGRHWLDVVRYADSDGYEYDGLRPQSWRYRDYVIRSFNQDKPYDRFIKEQIAGDELPDTDYDAVTGLGFLRNGPFIGDMVLMQNEMTRSDELDDIVSTTGTALLGLTVGCARCHDHKYDPIPQRDYYRMVAVFAPGLRKDVPLAPPAVVEEYDAKAGQIEKQIEAVRDEIKTIQKPTRERLLEGKYRELPEAVQTAMNTPPEKRTEAQKLQADQVKYSVSVADAEVLKELPPEERKQVEALQAKVAELEGRKPAPLPLAQAVKESGPKAPSSYFLHRGSVQSKGSEMMPGSLTVLNPSDTEAVFAVTKATPHSTGRRLALANWIASAENPLTARVMVNRIWQYHFGRGLVGTSNDYGRMGELPSHPELLDWLATEFVQRWSVKAMHRLILNSRTYQQASVFASPGNQKVDPENRYLWRIPLRRLEGEAIRDSILAVSGSLNRKMGGTGVFPEVDPEVLKGSAYQRWPKTKDGPEMWRRSVYVTQMRSITAPILDLFDPPDSISSCARRSVTTIAPQALQLLNNTFVAGQAEIFAERLRNEMGRDLAAQVGRAFLLAFGRPPTNSEVQESMQFLERQRVYHGKQNEVLKRKGTDPAEVLAPDKMALVDFCHSLLNLNEFVYIN